MYRSLTDFFTDMYGIVSFHYPQELIAVDVAVAEMVRMTRQRLIT